MMIVFDLVNRADPDEMPHIAAFHLGFHCLPKYTFTGIPPTKGYYAGALKLCERKQTHANISFSFS